MSVDNIKKIFADPELNRQAAEEARKISITADRKAQEVRIKIDRQIRLNLTPSTRLVTR